jgi:hypothetical protein
VGQLPQFFFAKLILLPPGHGCQFILFYFEVWHPQWMKGVFQKAVFTLDDLSHTNLGSFCLTKNIGCSKDIGYYIFQV